MKNHSNDTAGHKGKDKNKGNTSEKAAIEKRRRVKEYLKASAKPIMTHCEVAWLFDRTPAGLRQTIYTGKSTFATKLREAKRNFGRRSYFLTALIMELLGLTPKA